MLIIHLKRFNYVDGAAVKDNRRVNFAVTDLDMRPYLHREHQEASRTTLYSLYALVVGFCVSILASI